MTAFTTPTTRTAGQTLNATIWNALANNDTHFSETLTWTPTITQSVTVSKTTTLGWYGMSGKRVIGGCDLLVSSTGTTANDITLSLPVTASAAQGTSGLAVIGTGWIIDNSPLTGFQGAVICASTTTCKLRVHNSTTNVGQSFALASGDRITFSIQYLAA